MIEEGFKYGNYYRGKYINESILTIEIQLACSNIESGYLILISIYHSLISDLQVHFKII
jgi:hypothetical protein